MKKYIGLILLTLLFVGCKDDKDGNNCSGAPVITEVINNMSDNQSIEGASMGDWLVIKGQNFCDITEIYFNDVKINLNDIYHDECKISMKVPRTLPNENTETITVITPKGETVYNFKITIPPLSLDGLENEYVGLGKTAYIVGKNIEIYGLDSISGGWLQIGDSIITRLDYDFGYAEPKLRFKMPTKMTPGAEITLFKKDTLTGNLKIQHKFPGRFRDSRNVLFNLEKVLNGQFWGGTTVRTDGMDNPTLPDSISGKYALIQGPHDGNWHPEFWIGINLPINQFGSNVNSAELAGPVENITVVLEMNVVDPWASDNPTNTITIELFNHKFVMKPQGGALTTNGWTTFRIPLSQFYKEVGDEKVYITGEITQFQLDWEWLGCALKYEGAAAQKRLICWDNLRLIRNDK